MYKFNKVCIFCSNLQNGIDTFYSKKLSKLLSWHKDVIFITGCKGGCGAALSNYSHCHFNDDQTDDYTNGHTNGVNGPSNGVNGHTNGVKKTNGIETVYRYVKPI
jgi:hypothetical protein